MKNNKNKIAVYIGRTSVSSINSISKFAIAFLLLAGLFTVSPASAQISVGVNVNIPVWAPQYDNVAQVQYYYLPDIETYYDVWNHEFVYLEDGNWVFSAQLPPQYAGYDINNAFVVVLDANVHQPWMHFHYYVAHYPRYYYRTVYGDRWRGDHPVRGFNENGRGVVYRGDEHRAAQTVRVEPRNDASRIQRQPQRMQYYGKTVGSPVKVEKQMRRPPVEVKHDDHGRK